MSPLLRQAVSNQIIDVKLKPVCAGSTTPTLDTVLSMLKSVVSWNTMCEDHIAVIHCPSDSPYGGIIAACLLKYIDEYKTSSEGYDYYCQQR